MESAATEDTQTLDLHVKMTFCSMTSTRETYARFSDMWLENSKWLDDLVDSPSNLLLLRSRCSSAARLPSCDGMRPANVEVNAKLSPSVFERLVLSRLHFYTMSRPTHLHKAGTHLLRHGSSHFVIHSPVSSLLFSFSTLSASRSPSA